MGRQVVQSRSEAIVETLDTFAKMSASIGHDPMLVQGAGGNTSLKVGDTMWVKASGKWLSDACAENIFAPVDYLAMRSDYETGIEKNYAVYLRPESHLRPSIETGLHALMEKPVVIHAHPVNVLAHVVQVGAEKICAKLLADMNWSWIPYMRPGSELIRVVARAKRSDVLILQNHGVVIAGTDCINALDILNNVVHCFRSNVREDEGKPDFEYLNSLATDGNWRVPSCHELHSLATDSMSLQFVTEGPLSPDEVIFLGDRALIFQEGREPTEQWAAAAARAAVPSPYLIVPKRGILLHRTITRGAEAMLLAHARMFKRIRAGGRLSYLSGRDISALANWEAEKYRQALEQSRQIEAT